MADSYEDIRRQKREEFRKKKEEREQRQKEEKRKREAAAAAAAAATSKSNLLSTKEGRDPFVRLHGKYGFTWERPSGNDKPTHDKDVPTAAAASSARRTGASARHHHEPLHSILHEPTTRVGPVSHVARWSPGVSAASPLSSVTCSQSPSKHTVSFQQQQEEEDSEDPVEIARRLQRERQEEAKAQTKRAHDEEPSSCLEGSTVVLPPLPRRFVKRRLYNDDDGDDDDDDDEDPVKIMERLTREREEKRAKEAEIEARAKEPRNPIALLERKNESARAHSSPAENRNVEIENVDEDLWQDSEAEDEGSEPETTPKKKAAAKRKRSSEGDVAKSADNNARNAPRKKRSENGKNDKSRSSLESHRSNGYHSEDSIEQEDADLEHVLIPHFAQPKLGAPSALEPLVLPRGDNADDNDVHQVPASINRYLKPYQREGVAFLYSCVVLRGTGGVLGDDMGLGKTVQVISLLASLLRKTGTGKDAIELKRRRRLIAKSIHERNVARDEALLYNGVDAASQSAPADIDGLELPEYAPILIVVPPSIIDNWLNEFKTWGHFSVGAYQDKSRSVALDRVKDGTNEIMLCGKALFLGDFDAIATVPWKLVVIDEVHAYKNRKTRAYIKLESLKRECECSIIGLTGTLMQNNHEELWNLIDLIEPGHLGDWKTFKSYISVPILFGRTKTAEEDTIQRSIARHSELAEKLDEVHIRRTKEEELGEELPEKNEMVLFCEPTPIQKRLYEHILSLPDYELLRYATSPCDCGVNRALFQGYQKMQTNKEKIDYQRRHRNDIVPRKECCYKTPLNPDRNQEDQPWINPLATIWRNQHENDEACENCPYCIMFPALTKLYHLSSHAALLQAERDPNSLEVGSPIWKKATKDVEFATVAIPPDELAELPGGSYVMQDGIMTDHAHLSGKMQMLAQLLQGYSSGHNRVLLFSHWTKTLDLIQQFVQAQGYSFLRLDGSTKASLRQPLVDKFQADKTIFLFLISTKAGGLGLNLTAANKVICFDMDFNPSHEEQAQDRAYRIGQNQDVQVIRLVSQGTIEELKYVRQVYKVQLKQETMGKENADAPKTVRIFRGVQGDKNRKGELYGVENLLKFKDGSFMAEVWKSSGDRPPKGKKGIQPVRVDDMAKVLGKMTEKEVEEIGSTFHEAFDKAAGDAAARDAGSQNIDGLLGQNAINHQDFFVAGRGDAALRPGDVGFDEEVGGASQAVLNVLDRGGGMDDESAFEQVSPNESSPDNHAITRFLKGQTIINHQDLLDAERGDAALKEGDEGFDEEMGGASQMVLNALDRGQIDGASDSESIPEPSSPGKGVLDSKKFHPIPPIKESPPSIRYPEEDLIEAVSGSAFEPRPLPTIEESPPPVRHVQETSPRQEDGAAAPKKSKKRATPSKGEAPKTTFSALDIFIPTYKKKRKKTKK